MTRTLALIAIACALIEAGAVALGFRMPVWQQIAWPLYVALWASGDLTADRSLS